MSASHRAISVGFLLLLCCGFCQSVSARETLHALAECPAAGPDDVCFVAGITVTAQKITRRRTDGRTVVRTYLVRGDLDGGETKDYALISVQPIDDYFAATDHSGGMAMLGSFGGSPLVLTNRGPLLILTPEVGIERTPNIVVIDERSDQVVARYYDACVDLSFLNPTTKALWDEGRRTCVSTSGAPLSRKACRRPQKTPACDLPARFIPAPMKLDRLETVVRELQWLQLGPLDESSFGGTGWLVQSGRLKQTPFVVIKAYCALCNEEEPYVLKDKRPEFTEEDDANRPTEKGTSD